jgi:hypothetical protein
MSKTRLVVVTICLLTLTVSMLAEDSPEDSLTAGPSLLGPVQLDGGAPLPGQREENV